MTSEISRIVDQLERASVQVLVFQDLEAALVRQGSQDLFSRHIDN